MEAEREIGSVSDIAAIAKEAAESFGTNRLWWRGQGRYGWPLLPGVFRPGRGRKYEGNVSWLFRLGAATRCDRCPDEDDYAGWLYLMQHHGLPTRLLDWTESPLVGAYFSVWEYEEVDSDGALWVLSAPKLNTCAMGQDTMANPINTPAREMFAQPFLRVAAPGDKIVAVMTREIDIRMTVQLSAFTLHGAATPLEEMDSTASFLQKYRIPAVTKRSLIEELRCMGIRESNLFPDLDHLARDISHYQWDDDEGGG